MNNTIRSSVPGTGDAWVHLDGAALSGNALLYRVFSPISVKHMLHVQSYAVSHSQACSSSARVACHAAAS